MEGFVWNLLSKKFNIGLLRKSTEDAKADPKLWKSHSDGDAVVAADFEETLDNVRTPMGRVHESQGLKRWMVPTRPKDHDSRLH